MSRLSVPFAFLWRAWGGSGGNYESSVRPVCLFVVWYGIIIYKAFSGLKTLCKRRERGLYSG
jgi:hypothetical protein